VTELFDGGTLVVAVSLAALATRRRLTAATRPVAEAADLADAKGG
jgi:hypothetical protein